MIRVSRYYYLRSWWKFECAECFVVLSTDGTALVVTLEDAMSLVFGSLWTVLLQFMLSNVRVVPLGKTIDTVIQTDFHVCGRKKPIL